MTGGQLIKSIIDNIEKAIVGKRDIIEKVVLCLISDGHILIEDVPGVGKTSIVAALSRSLDCDFSRIQFTADIMPSDITGFSVYNPKSGDFTFKKGAVMSQFVLADEINRTTPKTQASLLEAMEERQVTVDGTTYKLPSPFMVLATQNPLEHLGTYPLPEAELDRFFMKISIGYPTPQEEIEILNQHKTESPINKLSPVATDRDILTLQRLVKDIFVHPVICDYIVNIVGETRNHQKVTLGASPRASLSLYRAAQARALMNDRKFVLPDDVKACAADVIAHRLVLKYEYRSAKDADRAVVNEILRLVPVPTVEKK